MKKYIVLAAVIVAIVSFGGITAVHAQTLTPAERVAMQQSLDVLKAKLVNLQMQQGMVPQGDDQLANNASVSAAPVMTQTQLSADNILALKQTLITFATTLQNLQTRIAQDPQFLTTNQASVLASLQGIATTLATIGTEVQSGNLAATTPSQPSQGIAQTTPNSGQTGGTQSTGNTTPTTGSNVPAQSTNNTPANTPAQTAQASNSFSLGKLNWPLIVVIILIVAAIAIWLFWDTEEEKTVVKTVANAPQKPMQPFTVNQSSVTQNLPANSGQQPPLVAPMPQQRKSA
jgi:hypothetical protein